MGKRRKVVLLLNLHELLTAAAELRWLFNIFALIICFFVDQKIQKFAGNF